MTTFAQYVLLLVAVAAALAVVFLFLILTNFAALWRFLKSAQRSAARGTVAVIVLLVLPPLTVLVFGWGGDLVEFIVAAEKKAGTRSFIFMFAPVCIPPAGFLIALAWSIVKKKMRCNVETVGAFVAAVPAFAAAAFWVRTAFYGLDEARLMFQSLLVLCALILVPAVFLLVPLFAGVLSRRGRERRCAEARGLKHPALLWLRASQGAGPFELPRDGLRRQ